MRVCRNLIPLLSFSSREEAYRAERLITSGSVFFLLQPVSFSSRTPTSTTYFLIPSRVLISFFQLFISCYNVTMSVYDISTIKRSIAIYFRLSSFRRASKETGVPRSTLHGWISRFGRGIDGRRGIVRRNSIYRRRKRDLVKSIVRNELDVNPFHTLSTLKRSTRTSLSLSSLSRVVSDIDYFLQKVYWRQGSTKVPGSSKLWKNREFFKG
jgi:transposase